MKCSCCGREITDKDRFCPNCGENNEAYVEVVETPKPLESQVINQSVANTSINSSTPLYVYNQTRVVHVRREGKGLGICALVFSILGGWLGLVLSIIGLSTYQDPENRKLCKIGLGFFIGWFIFCIILSIALS